MRVQLAPKLITAIKKQNVRIRNQFIKAVELFSKDPYNPQLNNHALRKDWEGFRSIDTTADYRAIFKEITEEEEPYAYFSLLGTHDELYGKRPGMN